MHRPHVRRAKAHAAVQPQAPLSAPRTRSRSTAPAAYPSPAQTALPSSPPAGNQALSQQVRSQPAQSQTLPRPPQPSRAEAHSSAGSPRQPPSPAPAHPESTPDTSPTDHSSPQYQVASPTRPEAEYRRPPNSPRHPPRQA